MNRLYQKINQAYVDSDLEANKRVVNNQFKFVAQNNEPFKRQSILEDITVFNIDKYFEELKLSIQSIIDNYISGNKINNASKPISIYNVMVSYLKNYTKSHLMSQRDKAMIEDKFDELKPMLKQAVDIGIKYKFSDIALLEQLLENIEDRHYIEIKLTAKQIKDFNEQIKRFEKPDFNIYVEKIDDMFKQISNKNGYVNEDGEYVEFSDSDKKSLLKKYEDFRTKLFKIRREPTLNTQLYEGYFKNLYDFLHNSFFSDAEAYEIPDYNEYPFEVIDYNKIADEGEFIKSNKELKEKYRFELKRLTDQFKLAHNWKSKISSVKNKAQYYIYFTKGNQIKREFLDPLEEEAKNLSGIVGKTEADLEKTEADLEKEALIKEFEEAGYPTTKLTPEERRRERKERDEYKKMLKRESRDYYKEIEKREIEKRERAREIEREKAIEAKKKADEYYKKATEYRNIPYHLLKKRGEKEKFERLAEEAEEKGNKYERIYRRFKEEFEGGIEEEPSSRFGVEETKGEMGEEDLTDEQILEREYIKEFGKVPSAFGKGKPKKKTVKKVVKKVVKKTIKKAVKKVKKHPDDILFEFLEEKLDLDDE